MNQPHAAPMAPAAIQQEQQKVLHSIEQILYAVQSATPYKKEKIVFDDNIERQISMAITETTEWSKFFPLKTMPASGDWLDAYPQEKRGQTFNAWYRGAKKIVYSTLTNPLKNSIGLVTVGQFDIYLTQQLYPLCDILSEVAKAYYFGLNIEILDAISMKGINSRHNANSNCKQLKTGSIESKLKQIKKARSNLCCLMGVSLVDLYPDESWNFVFGEASIHEQVGIFSFARYLPGFYQLSAINYMKYGPQRTKLESLKAMIDGEIEQQNKNWLNTVLDEKEEILFIRRCLGVLMHEIGHLFGLAHCPYFQCLMNGANHLEESDATPLHLCPVCLHKLFFANTIMQKTKANAAQRNRKKKKKNNDNEQQSFLDILQRYQVLSKLYHKYGLVEESRWCQQRAERLQQPQQNAANDSNEQEEAKDDK